jgi:hypothetical protein
LPELREERRGGIVPEEGVPHVDLVGERLDVVEHLLLVGERVAGDLDQIRQHVDHLTLHGDRAVLHAERNVKTAVIGDR